VALALTLAVTKLIAEYLTPRRNSDTKTAFRLNRSTLVTMHSELLALVD
jgi:hypothetical protein